MVVGKSIEARPMMYVALTYDHRLIDGREVRDLVLHSQHAGSSSTAPGHMAGFDRGCLPACATRWHRLHWESCTPSAY